MDTMINWLKKALFFLLCMIAKALLIFTEVIAAIGIFFLCSSIWNVQNKFILAVSAFVLSPLGLYFLGFYKIRKKELTELDEIYKKGI